MRVAFPAGEIAGSAAEAEAGVAASRLRSDSSVRALASSVWSGISFAVLAEVRAAAVVARGADGAAPGVVGEVGGWVWDGRSRRVGDECRM
jgi:hypothetical protein